MSLLLWGLTLSVIGKALLALGIIWVHITMATERSIDEQVVRSFRFEFYITIIGFTLILLGYLFEVYAYGGFNVLMDCGMDCSAAIIDATSR